MAADVLTPTPLVDQAVDELRAKLTRKALHDLADELAPKGELYVSTTYPQIKDGLCFSVSVWPDQSLYIYAVPWSRGWSVWVDDRTKHEIPTWNTVKTLYQGLTRPLYCARQVSGCWNVPTKDVAASVLDLADHIHRMSMAKRNVYMREHWPRALYWYFVKDNLKPSYRHDLPWDNQ